MAKKDEQAPQDEAAQQDDAAQQQESDEKPEWDESTHGPVPEGAADQYNVTKPDEGGDQAEQVAQEESQQDQA